ncbi:MAG: FkbM family methyltransferase [Xenococcaceae cyanobacterium]
MQYLSDSLYNWLFSGYKILASTFPSNGSKLSRRVRYRIDSAFRRISHLILPNPLRVRGHTLYYPQQSCFILSDIAAGVFEQETNKILSSLLKPGMSFVDVGAHIGYFTLIAANSLSSSGRVFSFEPDPSNFELLQKNVEVNDYADYIETIPLAVSNICGKLELFSGNLDLSQSSLFKNSCTSQNHVSVEATTLDIFFENHGFPSIDVIKMDIEGGEVFALEGMVEICKRNQNLKLIIEFLPGALQVAGVEPERYFRCIQNLGFSKISIIENSLKPIVISQDIPWLLDYAAGGVNLLCEK